MAARDKLIELIEAETNMYADKDTNRIIIGGFGQGCSLVATTFLYLPGDDSYGGIICIGGLLPLANIPTPQDIALKETKFLIFAGADDEKVWPWDTKDTINKRLNYIVYKNGY